MELLHQHFLQILSAVLHGRRDRLPDSIGQEQWQALFSLGQLHKLLPMVYEGAYLKGALQTYPGLASTRSLVLRQIMEQTMKTSELQGLYKTLSAAGIKPLVLKGIVCRSLYPKADIRPSADEDLLIRPEDCSRCIELLLELGYTQMGSDDGEITFVKPGSALHIELHTALFPQEQSYGSMNALFDGIFDRAGTMELGDAALAVPDHTDHLLYLICHGLKHFLHSGFGIRQVCDILLYARAWGHLVDWNRIISGCRAVRGEVFAAALFHIGVNHLGFDADGLHLPESWREMELCEVPLLDDILRAGIYGTSTSARQHSSSITLEAAGATMRGERAKGALSAALFPPAVQLRGRYPYLKKHPWLLPVAWGSRILGYKKGRAASMEALQTGHSRLKLLEQYNIIEKT